MRHILDKKILWKTVAVFMLLFVIFKFYKCPIKLLTGQDCLGCGMTRAIISFIKMDFKQAFKFHCLFPLGAFAGGYFVLNFLFPEKINIGKKAERGFLIVFFTLSIIVWAVKRYIQFS